MRDDDDEKRTATVNIRLKPSIKAEAEEIARADGRSLTSFIEKAISEYGRRIRQDSKGA